RRFAGEFGSSDSLRKPRAVRSVFLRRWTPGPDEIERARLDIFVDLFELVGGEEAVPSRHPLRLSPLHRHREKFASGHSINKGLAKIRCILTASGVKAMATEAVGIVFFEPAKEIVGNNLAGEVLVPVVLARPFLEFTFERENVGCKLLGELGAHVLMRGHRH